MKDIIRKKLLDYINSDFSFESDKEYCQILADEHDVHVRSVQNLLSEINGVLRVAKKDPTGGRCGPCGPSEEKNVHKVLILPDVHVPYHDEEALGAVENLMRGENFDELVILGDLIDAYSISSFDKDTRKENLQVELDVAKKFLKKWRSIFLDKKITLLEGNHEHRLKRLLMKNPGLLGLEALKIENLLGLKELEIDFYPYMEPYRVGDSVFVHGKAVSKHSCYSGKRTLMDGGFKNVFMGHTHRAGMFFKTGFGGRRRAIECGHLCDVDQADYIQGVANWQEAVCVATFVDDKLVDANLLEVFDGKIFYGGDVYEAA